MHICKCRLFYKNDLQSHRRYDLTCLVLVEQKANFVSVQPLHLNLQRERSAESRILDPLLWCSRWSTRDGKVATVSKICGRSSQNCIIWSPPNPKRCSQRNKKEGKKSHPRHQLLHRFRISQQHWISAISVSIEEMWPASKFIMTTHERHLGIIILWSYIKQKANFEMP